MPKIYKLFKNPTDSKENPLTYDKLMQWLIETHWVENRIKKIISPLDIKYLEDYTQEVWYQILTVPHDKMLDIYRKGKGKFVNYIKSIIVNNTYSTSSPLYKNLRSCRQGEIFLDDSGWCDLTNQGQTNIEIYFPQMKNHEVYFESEIIRATSEINLLNDEDNN